MFKCKECGKLYESLEDAKEKRESIEYGERTYYETNCYCYCGGELEEVQKCKICGEIAESEICDKCLKIEKCFKVGEEHKQCLELNGFVASMFDTNEIEEILMRELKESQELGITNKYDFIDYLEKYIKERVKMSEELNKVVKKFFKESDEFIAKNKPIAIINEEIYDKIEDKCLTEYKDPAVASEVAGRIYDEFMKEFDKWVEKLDVRGR